MQLPGTFLEPVEEPLLRLVRRYARTHGPFTTREASERYGIDVEIVRHPASRKGGRWSEGQMTLFEAPRHFTVLPKRWVVERTNAWNDRPRRMNKDHDRNLGVSTAWIWLLIIGAGMFGVSGQLVMTYSYRYAPASTIAPPGETVWSRTGNTP